ncbi:MAG: sigma-70 family RNA polymerase sigma factor [Chloroflexi bacterium]|nr:sigma-70 family RNA polymerase sigma factor [Chloroflexota bacterium]MCI0840708.1 sigma-70 family RNA polymerase sigma factor [Chloroflexota bacterium]MCI0886932.1 sigma-70 family RNA polymerase sigma factor [Chloroflexota bacterium]
MQAQINANAEVATLVRMAQEGDTSSFGELYERFFDQIYRYVSFKTGSPSEAEDITGEVFVRMLESIHKFKWQGHPFSSWLFRIAHNLVVDHFRRKGKRNVVSLDNATINVEAVAVDVDSHIDTEMSMDEVRKAMVGLTVLQKEVISLRFAAGLSVAETAEAVGKKENAVKALQHAGLKKLRRFLNPELSTPSILLQQQQET